MTKINTILFYFLLVLCSAVQAGQDIHPECLKSFKKDGAIPGESSCPWKCQIHPNLYIKDTMILCSGYCDKFCNSKKDSSTEYTLASLYPGLTDKEKAIASKEPIKTLKAYNLSWDAEKICLSLYAASDTNDESDACRHFVWAALLTNELGVEFAEAILDAHESNPLQPSAEEKMDRANNKIGIIEGKKSQGIIKKDEIIKSFQKNLKSGKLTVLNKSIRGGK